MSKVKGKQYAQENIISEVTNEWKYQDLLRYRGVTGSPKLNEVWPLGSVIVF